MRQNRASGRPHDPIVADHDSPVPSIWRLQLSEIDGSEKPSISAPLTAVLLLPLFWWMMYEFATDFDPSRFGRRAAIKAILDGIAESLGPTGCVLLGLLTTGAAAYWLFKTNQERVLWEKEARLEAMRARRRFDEARREKQG
jgi:hypothetical protein